MKIRRRINYPTVNGLPQDYKTYRVAAPLRTHWRRATCAEYLCWALQNGFMLRQEDMTPQQMYGVRNSGRRFREVEVSPTEHYFIFEPGQECFDKHYVQLDRPEFFFVGRGDHRAFNVRSAHQHTNAEDFVDDMSNHLDLIRTMRERG